MAQSCMSRRTQEFAYLPALGRAALNPSEKRYIPFFFEHAPVNQSQSLVQKAQAVVADALQAALDHLTLRQGLDQLRAIQMVDVHPPTTDGVEGSSPSRRDEQQQGLSNFALSVPT